MRNEEHDREPDVPERRGFGGALRHPFDMLPYRLRHAAVWTDEWSICTIYGS